MTTAKLLQQFSQHKLYMKVKTVLLTVCVAIFEFSKCKEKVLHCSLVMINSKWTVGCGS